MPRKRDGVVPIGYARVSKADGSQSLRRATGSMPTWAMGCRSGAASSGRRGSASRPSDYGRDYRLGYSLGALGGAGTAFELGVDAQRPTQRPRSDRGHQTTEEQASPQEAVRYCPCQTRRDVAPTSPRQGA